MNQNKNARQGIPTLTSANDQYTSSLSDSNTDSQEIRLLSFGKYDTLKDTPGAMYDTLSSEDVVSMVMNPTALSKEDALYGLASSTNDRMARSGEFQTAHGEYRLLPVDIDAGNHELAEVVGALKSFIPDGSELYIYSTSSAQPTKRKWRGFTFMVPGIGYEEYRLTQYALFEHMAGLGIEVDQAMALPAQPVIYPNVVPANRNPDGSPKFYETHIEYPGALFNPKNSPSIQSAIARIKETERIEAVNALQAANEVKARAEARLKANGGKPTTIDLFNNRPGTIEDDMAAYGYKRYSETSSKWQGPEQSSGSYAFITMVAEGVAISHSGTYADKAWGAQAKSGCRYADRFDLYCFHEHENDRNVALKALSLKLTVIDEDTGEVLTLNEQYRRDKQKEASRKIGEGDDEFNPITEVFTVQEMLKRFVFLSDGARVFDQLHPMHVVKMCDFRQATAASYTEIETGEFTKKGPKLKRLLNAALWLNSNERLTSYSTTFKAGGERWIKDPQGKSCVNMWNGFRRRDVTGGDATLFLDHVRWLFKDRAEDFLDWLAHIEQYPGVLPHTAWLHISSKTGTGRNALSGILARVFAGYTATSLDLMLLLDTGFNERLSRKLLAVVDEIREGGTGQWDHAEALKQMITSETRAINKKTGGIWEEFNACRFLMFSNHRQAIPLDDTDRRVEVVINDDAPRSEEYYKALYSAMNDPAFISAVGAFLAERNLAKFNAGAHAKKTAHKRQVIASTSVDERDMIEAFNTSYPLELATAQRLAHEFGVDVRSSGRFRNVATDAGWIRIGRKTFNKNQFQVWCRSEAYPNWEKKKTGFEKQIPKIDGGDVDLILESAIGGDFD